MTKRRSLERPARLGKTDAVVLNEALNLLLSPCRFTGCSIDDPVCDKHLAARIVRKLRNRVEDRPDPEQPQPDVVAARRAADKYLGGPLTLEAVRAIHAVMPGHHRDPDHMTAMRAQAVDAEIDRAAVARVEGRE